MLYRPTAVVCLSKFVSICLYTAWQSLVITKYVSSHEMCMLTYWSVLLNECNTIQHNTTQHNTTKCNAMLNSVYQPLASAAVSRARKAIMHKIVILTCDLFLTYTYVCTYTLWPMMDLHPWLPPGSCCTAPLHFGTGTSRSATLTTFDPPELHL